MWFLHTLCVFPVPPTLTMMHLCITQWTYWTPVTVTDAKVVYINTRLLDGRRTKITSGLLTITTNNYVKYGYICQERINCQERIDCVFRTSHVVLCDSFSYICLACVRVHKLRMHAFDHRVILPVTVCMHVGTCCPFVKYWQHKSDARPAYFTLELQS